MSHRYANSNIMQVTKSEDGSDHPWNKTFGAKVMKKNNQSIANQNWHTIMQSGPRHAELVGEEINAKLQSGENYNLAHKKGGC